MAKVDLHVHSQYSDYPSTWGHKVYNSPESFTDIDTVYLQAKRRGMRFVTLTDHDDIRGSLELTQKYPNDTFMSCEVTTYFPEDNCKIHILVYGLTEFQYERISQIRFNIYDLRDYIVEQNLAYSVAHATHDQDGRLTFAHIEKLVVMFDVFEVINGACSAQNNQLLHRYLKNLDQPTLELLQQKHNLQPISNDPWVKGYTGGSDDHCGILIGSAYAQVDTDDVEGFIQGIKDKKSLANGLHGSFETYATGVIKHVHDYRLNRDSKYENTKMNDFFELFFNGNEGNLMRRFKKSQSLRYLKKKNTKTHQALHSLLKQISEDVDQDMETKIPQAYRQINTLHDEMFRSVVVALTKHLPSGDIFKGFQKLGTLFPMTLLAAPFIGSMRHQHLKSEVKRGLIDSVKQSYREKALWFTDTIDDLNGVSVTLHQIANQSAKYGYQLKLVTCENLTELSSTLPVNTLNFSPIKQVQVPGYEQQQIGFPSLLSMMRRISLEQPDQIIISTPGPLGLGAMLCAKLMGIRTKAVYHTDFAEQIIRMTNEPMLAQCVDQLVNAFYKMTDEVFVPSQFYIGKLVAAGLEPSKMQLFPRGLDLDLYRPQTEVSKLKRDKADLSSALQGDFTLLFAGRISEDKNLSLLTRIAKLLNQDHHNQYNLVIAGDGPDLSTLKTDLASLNNVRFTGRLKPEELVDWYRRSDLFVFPSHTDTFGMVVLEAQACGVPCLVTNTGGPKEIIHSDTGRVIASDDAQQWVNAINDYRNLKINDITAYQHLTKRCHEHVSLQSDWQLVLDKVLGPQCRKAEKSHPFEKSLQPKENLLPKQSHQAEQCRQPDSKKTNSNLSPYNPSQAA